MEGWNLRKTSKSLRKYLAQHPRVVEELIAVLAMYGTKRTWNDKSRGKRMDCLEIYITRLNKSAIEWDTAPKTVLEWLEYLIQ